MSRELPANLLSLHSGEESLRTKSIEAIQACDDLSRHAAFIERCMDIIDILCRAYDTKDATELIVQHLGARMFNTTASALKLLLSGYYQASALLQRDMLETIFLLDYFTTDAALIQRWHALPPRERWKEFKPAVVRTALDDRDGFTKRRRQEAYDLLTELAGHPAPQGFVMLHPKGMEAHLGPFVDPTAPLGAGQECLAGGRPYQPALRRRRAGSVPGEDRLHGGPARLDAALLRRRQRHSSAH